MIQNDGDDGIVMIIINHNIYWPSLRNYKTKDSIIFVMPLGTLCTLTNLERHFNNNAWNTKSILINFNLS